MAGYLSGGFGVLPLNVCDMNGFGFLSSSSLELDSFPELEPPAAGSDCSLELDSLGFLLGLAASKIQLCLAVL